MPQTWVERNLRCDNVWRVENFDEGIEQLNRNFDCAYTPGILNKSRYDSQDYVAADSKSSREFAVAGIVPSRQSFDTREARALVSSAYAVDYETFNYPVP